MKDLLALILVLFIVFLEYKNKVEKNKVEKFNDNCNNINELTNNDRYNNKSKYFFEIPFKPQCYCEYFENYLSSESQILKSLKCNKNLLWIYNPYDYSSKIWESFGSRMNFYKNNISKLCIKSIFIHLNDNFEIILFDQKMLKILLPEYKQLISVYNNPIHHYKLIKFLILYKFGGLWLPNDTIIFQSFNLDNELNTNKILLFKTSKLSNLLNNDILAVSKHNPLFKNIIHKYKQRACLHLNISANFNNEINLIFDKNLKINNNYKDLNILVEKDLNHKFITYNDIFSIFNNNLGDISRYKMIHLEIDKIKKIPKFNYIFKLSTKDLLNSKMFISTIFKFSFGIKNNISHIPLL